MLLTYLMLAVALMLSAVAAFYSIIGLTAIFAAAVWPIVIMGTILEAAKLTVTVWLHEYWSQVKVSMKLYLVSAVFMLMVITSMGIFGFLSKAHLDQVVPTGDVQAQVSLIDEKITNERDTIATARTLLTQLDRAVTDISNTADQEIKLRDGTTQIRSSAERALQVRRSQAQDRAGLTKTIEQSQSRIVTLQAERAPFAKDLRAIEAEVGPIKYIAALIYGDDPDANLLEKAVRWVIMILVVVFDPLAIMMLLAATESYRWERQSRKAAVLEDLETVAEPVPASEAQEPQQSSMEPAASVAQSNPLSLQIAPAPPQSVPYHILDDDSEPEYPDDADAPDPQEDDITDKRAKRAWKVENPDDTLHRHETMLAQGKIDRLPWQDELVARADSENYINVDFGTSFPPTPTKGNAYIRVDYLPSRLFKWNGNKWIEVDKNATDSFTYNESYIDHLIAKIASGEYDPELLNHSERQQIEQRLRNDNQAGGINV